MLVQQYQSRVLGPTETVDYSNIVMQAYPAYAIQSEPFIGFKVLCTDTNAYNNGNPSDRLRFIDANLGFLRGKGCIIRETSPLKPDGFWVITMPVPRSQVSTAINNLMDVLAILSQYLGIVSDGLFEINVSGKCHVAETERRLGGLTISPDYLANHVPPDNSPYRLGHIIRINDNFMVLRTRWDLSKATMSITNVLTTVPQLIASMYH